MIKYENNSESYYEAMKKTSKTEKWLHDLMELRTHLTDFWHHYLFPMWRIRFFSFFCSSKRKKERKNITPPPKSKQSNILNFFYICFLKLSIIVK